MAEADTFPRLLKLNTEKFGTQIAMEQKNFGIWKQYTWENVYEQVKLISLGLICLGMEPGDKVAILGDSGPEWFWFQMAVQSSGGIVVGLFPDVVAAEVKYIYEHSDSRFIVAKDQEQVDKVFQIQDELQYLKRVIYWDADGLWNYKDPILMSYKQLTEIGKEYDSQHPGAFEGNVAKGEADDICFLGYTSGTTGAQKAVMLSHRSLISNIQSMARSKEISERDDYFSMFPGAWVGEQIWGIGMQSITGMRIIFAEKTDTAQQDLREVSPTICPVGPRQWESLASIVQARMSDAGLLKRVCYNLLLPVGYKADAIKEQRESLNLFWRSLHIIAHVVIFRPLKDKLGFASRTRMPVTGSAALGPDIIRFFSVIGLHMENAYATSEGGGFHSMHRSDDIKMGTIGPPLPGTNIRITGRGEITINSESLCQGYYKASEATEQAIENGWFHTGDAGFVDDDGHLVFLDRVKELGELANGHKYSPTYIEGKLKFSPYVKEAVAIGGNKRDYVSVIINVDFENVGKWAEKRRIPYTTFVDMSQKEEVARLVLNDITRVNRSLPEHSKVRRYALLHKEFDPDEAELTRTRKLRRAFFEDRYQELIDAIYEDKKQVIVEAAVKYRDGRTGVIKTDLKIWQVEGALA